MQLGLYGYNLFIGKLLISMIISSTLMFVLHWWYFDNFKQHSFSPVSHIVYLSKHDPQSGYCYATRKQQTQNKQ